MKHFGQIEGPFLGPLPLCNDAILLVDLVMGCDIWRKIAVESRNFGGDLLVAYGVWRVGEFRSIEIEVTVHQHASRGPGRGMRTAGEGVRFRPFVFFFPLMYEEGWVIR